MMINNAAQIMRRPPTPDRKHHLLIIDEFISPSSWREVGTGWAFGVVISMNVHI